MALGCRSIGLWRKIFSRQKCVKRIAAVESARYAQKCEEKWKPDCTGRLTLKKVDPCFAWFIQIRQGQAHALPVAGTSTFPSPGLTLIPAGRGQSASAPSSKSEHDVCEMRIILAAETLFAIAILFGWLTTTAAQENNSIPNLSSRSTPGVWAFPPSGSSETDVKDFLEPIHAPEGGAELLADAVR